MKISTYNVNGIRAATKKGLVDWLKMESPDVVCLQEIKADADQFPDELFTLGYEFYIHPAQKKGYSGVAILTKRKPVRSFVGMGIDWVDAEGRILTVEFEELRVVSVYAPSGTTGEERQAVKYRFLDVFLDWMRAVSADGKPTVFCGDINIAHMAIDIHNPISNKNTSGFLPEERAWFTSMLDAGYEDVFRALHPGEKDLYSWWTVRANAKANNKGWRIDYHIATKGLSAKATDARMTRELNLSDHVPVTVTYTVDGRP
jgi:exodeoxyribonuclease-3